MVSVLRVAVVGSRGFGSVHLAALARLRDEGFPVEVYTFSSNRGEAKAFAERFGAAGFFTTYDEVLRSNVDVVDLVVSHDAHASMSIQALTSGKHVVLEKPIARTVEEAQQIVTTAERLGLKFMVAENYHFDSTFTELYEVLRGLGRPHTIIVRDTNYNQPSGWRRVKELMGGGAVIDGGIHMIHVMLNAGGDYDSVCATTHRSGTIDMEGEDVGLAIFRFRSGARGVYMYGWAFRNSPAVPVIEVYAEKGAVYEDPSTRLVREYRGVWYLSRHGDLVVNGERRKVPEGDAIEDELRGFLEAVEKGGDVPMPTELELRDLRAVLDIYSASARC
ncbi:MAG: Gfo/Idh/MocA family protein [Acidilobus sp.]